jgi:hypothetical protein
MKKSRFLEAQIIAILKEGEADRPVAELTCLQPPYRRMRPSGTLLIDLDHGIMDFPALYEGWPCESLDSLKARSSVF